MASYTCNSEGAIPMALCMFSLQSGQCGVRELHIASSSMFVVVRIAAAHIITAGSGKPSIALACLPV
jgi:hypothetical protein